jgi:23S rRNA pseudouridine2605 synthase
LLGGVALDGVWVEVRAAKVLSTHADRSLVELKIHEGRNRIVRRLLEQVGHPVRQLTRTAIGPVLLVGLRSGELRELTPDELGVLLDAADL